MVPGIAIVRCSARPEHPVPGIGSMVPLQQVVGSQELAMAISQHAGCAAAHAVIAASTFCKYAMTPVCSALVAMHPICIVVIGGSTSGSWALDIVESFNVSTASWTTLPPMLTPRCSCATAALGTNVFCVGGGDENNRPLAALECFNTESGCWIVLPPMPTARRGCALVALGICLYAVGGADDTGPLAVLERYDTKIAEWALLQSMPTPRSRCAAAAVGGHVYVAGGTGMDRRGKSVALSTACHFDPGRETWTSLPSMRTKSSSCAGTAMGCQFYAMGSEALRHGIAVPCSELATLKLDNRTAIWVTLPSMRLPRGACAASGAEDHVYVLGGWTQHPMDYSPQYSNAVERFHPETRTWDVVAQMPTPRAWCAAVKVRVSLDLQLGTRSS